MTRMYISLNDETIKVLSLLAREERRNIRQQAAWILEEELQRRGLLQAEPITVLPADVSPLVGEDPKLEKRGSNVTQ